MRRGAARRRPSRARARPRSARRQNRGRWYRVPAARQQRRADRLRWWAYAVSFDAPAGANRVESSRVYPYGAAVLRRTGDDTGGLGEGLACPPHERGKLDTRQTRVDIRTDERGFPDTYRTRVDIWTEFAAKAPKTVQISTLDIRPSENPRSSITRVSLVPHSSLI